MLLFFPIKTGEMYDQDQRTKYIYNHETYLGNEDVTSIHGLHDLNTEITLKGGTTTSIRMLLKSGPVTQGMQCNHLFHIVDPNAGHTCTIATFQNSDKSYIEHRKLSLEHGICSVLDKVEASKVFIDEIEGICFGSTVKHKNGKPISIHTPSKTNMEFQKHTNSILNHPLNRKCLQQYSPSLTTANTPTTETLDPIGHTVTPQAINQPTITQSPNLMINHLTATIGNRFCIVETELNFQRAI
jgi:hypothetical protein